MSPIGAIFEILRNAGQGHYGDGAVTQFEHAVQCAILAEREGASPALIAAALLHDIGHLVTPDDRAAAQRREDGEHERIGAD
ncbi:MAG: HD domain-containing protein [Stellaceae bacterium]